MIIDAHAHIIERINGQRGGKRTSPASYGRVLIGDTEHQMLPPFLAGSDFPADMLLAVMDAHETAKAVLLQNPVYGIMNEDIAAAVRQYPDRFIGTIQVDPFDEGAFEVIRRFSSPAQSVLKFEMSRGWGWTGIYEEVLLDSDHFIRFWELASELNMKVIIDPGPIGNPGYQVDRLERVVNEFPRLPILVEHLGYMTADKYPDKAAREEWLRMVRLARKKNVCLGFSAIFSLMEEDYPCPVTMELLQQAVQEAGAGKILWGTDVPTTLGRYTYRQMMDLILKHAPFLDEHEKMQIMGQNALDFFNW